MITQQLTLPTMSLLEQLQILGVADSAPLLVKHVPLVLSNEIFRD